MATRIDCPNCKENSEVRNLPDHVERSVRKGGVEAQELFRAMECIACRSVILICSNNHKFKSPPPCPYCRRSP